MTKENPPATSFISGLKLIYSFLTRREKSLVGLNLLGQLVMSLLELIALVFTGALLSIIITVSTGNELGDRVKVVLRMLGLTETKPYDLIFLLSLLTLFLFLGRTAISAFFIRKSLFYSGAVAARLSYVLAAICLHNPLKVEKLQINHQEISYAVSGGALRFFTGVLGSFMLLISDFVLLIVVCCGLLYVDITTTLVLLVYFSILAGSLHILTIIRVRASSRTTTSLGIDSSHFLLESLDLIREFRLRGLIDDRLNSFSKLRNDITKHNSYIQFLPHLSKYVLDIGILVGIFSLASMQYFELNFSRGAATIGLFAIAGARLAPSIFRIQQNLTSIASAVASTLPVQTLLKYSLSDEFKKANSSIDNEANQAQSSFGTVIRKSEGINVTLENVSFDFGVQDTVGQIADKQNLLLHKFSTQFPANSINAIVGQSGTGKTTLFDLIIGEIEPSCGQVFLDGISPKVFTEQFPGAVAIVPQFPKIVQGDLIFNIVLRRPISSVERDRALELIGLVGLDSDQNISPDEILGYGDRKLSGGQIQRVALARALYTDPRLLLLDEFTSGLDEISEQRILEVLRKESTNRTILLASHKRKTIQACDNFFRIYNGRVFKIDSASELFKRMDKDSEITF